ncbi:MAG: phosphate ABC transporter permease subunit PstC, partial [Bacteroidales bacterium]|nr:phosphate ABC transporter permease subunit PstC [Bacteroidales bacterium]
MKKNIKKRLEKAMEAVLFSSSGITSLAVILIILFLFKEGVGLFHNSPLEKGYVIAIHPENPVKKLTTKQIVGIFNQDITHWSEAGGTNDSIIRFSMDDIDNYFTEDELGSNFEYLPGKLNHLIVSTPGIIAFIPKEYLPKDFKGRILPVHRITVSGFLGGKHWYPTTQPVAEFGILPIILGTLWVSLGAILIALPLGLATAVYMAEVSKARFRNFLKPVIELLAGIPSVVYGFFGLIVVVPMIQKLFGLPVGETAL